MKRILAPLVLTLALIPASAASAYVNPVNVTPPTIEGTPQVGQTLKINPGTWTPTPTSYTYSWERCTSTGTECNYLEPYVNTNTYVPTTADVGHKMRALVVAWNGPVFGNTWTAPVGPVTEEATVFVSSKPTGPTEPASGWSVSYADQFARTIGTAAEQDNTWFANAGGGTESSCKVPTNDCSGSATNELEVNNSSQLSITPEGLKITCEYLGTTGVEATNKKSGDGKKHYRCGVVQGPYCCHTNQAEQAGYNAPLVHIVSGVTYVFEAKLQLPVNTSDGDPAFWMDGPPFGNTEIDFPEVTAWGEGEGYNGTNHEGHAAHPLRWHDFAGAETSFGGLGELETKSHTYTTEFVPAASGKHKMLVWIDGVKKYESGEITDLTVENKNPLILQYALRECTGSPCGTEGGSGTNGSGISIGFKTTGQQRFLVARSVAVYQDKEHAGSGIEKPTAGAAAPGTIIK